MRVFQAAHPVHEGRRVVQAQIFDIENFETGAGHLIERTRDVRYLAAGKRKAVDELATRRAMGAALAVSRPSLDVCANLTMRRAEPRFQVRKAEIARWRIEKSRCSRPQPGR